MQLFSSRRRVRLFLMDVEDEDEEEADTDADTTAQSGMDDSQPVTDRSQNGEDKENTSFASADTSLWSVVHLPKFWENYLLDTDSKEKGKESLGRTLWISLCYD